MTELIGFHTRITKELKDELKDYCKKEGRSTQFVVEKALNEFINKKDMDRILYINYLEIAKKFKLPKISYGQYLVEKYDDMELYNIEF